MNLSVFSGAFLEDAMVLQCGHSFGGLMLKKVIEMVCFKKSFCLSDSYQCSGCRFENKGHTFVQLAVLNVLLATYN